MLIDSHAHLDDEKFSDKLSDILLSAKNNGVEKVICSAYDLQSSKNSVEISEKYDNVYSTIGVHPENVEWFKNDDLEVLKTLSKSKKVVAIGEIGLDYFYDNYDKQKQGIVFQKQIELANQLNLPIVIHSRFATEDTVNMIIKNADIIKKGGLLHCYSGSFETAKILMKHGFYFSFGGITTFKNASKVREVVKNIPIERILLETDCPYLSPEPHRGEINEPKRILDIAKKVTEIKEIDLSIVENITSQNCKQLFGV